MTLYIADTHKTGVLTIQQDHELGHSSMFLGSDEQRELLEALARHLGATVTFPGTPTESAWVVIPQTPGMPVSDGGPSGFNMLPCKLEAAQEAAGRAGDDWIFQGLSTITEAFQVAVRHYGGSPAYIIDHDNGAYSVIV